VKGPLCNKNELFFHNHAKKEKMTPYSEEFCVFGASAQNAFASDCEYTSCYAAKGWKSTKERKGVIFLT
jgi:hypothetical protein